MKDKRERALDLLRKSKERLEILQNHLVERSITLSSADDYRRAQEHPDVYADYSQFSFIVHELDLATEGVRQVREMGQTGILDALDANIEGDVNDFIALHSHLFHTYDGIDADILYDTVSNDVPMMIAALSKTLDELCPASQNATEHGDGQHDTVDLSQQFQPSKSKF